MTKKQSLIVAFCFCFSQFGFGNFHPSYDPEDWPKHIIRFPAEGTLKDVFDAGIRPYRFPSLERVDLGFKHIHASFEMKTGELLPSIPVEHANVGILEGGLISSLEVTSQKLSVQEAENAMTPFLQKGKRTAQQLRDLLAKAAADPRGYDDPYTGDTSGFQLIWKDEAGPQYAVFFKSTFDGEKPVRIAMMVSFFPLRTPRQERSTYNIPIPPPPGYEHVSMDAPRNFGPDSAVEIDRSRGIDIGDGKGGITQEEYLRRQAELKEREDKKTNGTQSAEPAAKATNHWLWILLIPLLVLIWRFKMKLSKR